MSNVNQDIKLLVKESFPCFANEDRKIDHVLLNDSNKFIYRYIDDQLVGISIIKKDTILFLAVKEKYQNQGLGSSLLLESEEYIKSNGYKKIRVANSGNGNFSPGIPSSSPDTDTIYNCVDLYNGLNNKGHMFFKKRGYYNSWGEDVFDMHMDLKDAKDDYKINDRINGIDYVRASKEDLPSVLECINDAEKGFVSFYNHDYYFNDDSSIMLIAKDKNEVVGALLVSYDKKNNIGTIGCTSVKNNHRRMGIATNLVLVGTKYIKDSGVKRGFLCFTHTGLDKLYGVAGYKICIYYFMAMKNIK